MPLAPGPFDAGTMFAGYTFVRLPIAEESPVRVCTQQTGQTRRQCREDIRRSNGLP
ncbi:MAG: serine/threonine protein kinase, bacterial [Mycobacterium sp.]|jgi:serine/threonine-protein kinase|nr:serine/threonine protein kinase, bacterial [Mycobacterium sp.]MDT5194414.1 serine/threonine protein kinase, bacterial [Mycobacterium sp.]MDT5240195.1 serine/threonine protein kinase, bacterial [Mycobacterium sp.]MDT5287670.1 serine/threonine protein kinase, bacterial [Mycobacterium sp.]